MMPNPPPFVKAKKQIEIARGKLLRTDERIELSLQLAASMLQDAHQTQNMGEARMQKRFARMMKDPLGKAFTTMMTDQCFRTNNPKRIANQLCYLLGKMGVPKYLSWVDQLMLRGFRMLGPLFPQLFVPLTKYAIRRETSSVILPGEPAALARHIKQRQLQGIKVNLNHLGEAILGEEEAKKRLQTYLDDLTHQEIDYISIKISTLYSQIQLLAWEDTLQVLSERLQKLYRTSMQYPDKNGTAKFVNLDMEEYKDLHLTVAVFKKVLELPEFFHYSAGIVLQAYLPDSYPIQQELTQWAIQRINAGGAPIKIRIVKGANLAMEQVEASLKTWPQAPFSKKSEVDASFKRMITYGCVPEHAKAAHIGIGSHNLFDIAYGMILRSEYEVEDEVNFEMLEGMAEPMRRVVQALSGSMLLYCPAARKEEFQNAVAYLIRRLDENTGPENFLRHAFSMVPKSLEWEQQAEMFKAACTQMEEVSFAPRRTQNRLQQPPMPEDSGYFQNEADTDWSLPQNRQWGVQIVETWKSLQYPLIPLVIDGKEIIREQDTASGNDPSYPETILYRYVLASKEDVETAVICAVNACEEWQPIPLEQRCDLLKAVAQEMRKERHTLLGAMLADCGKTLPEGDVEISEAIDFAEYYQRLSLELHQHKSMRFHPKGVVLVTPPWNFPCSIPAGGILAALATGNTVIFKPAPESVLVGWHLVNLFWNAGIPKQVLQFINCDDEPVGATLIQDPRIASIILTGATSTAKLFRKLRPEIDLIAETGGKNAIIATDMADRDLAIKDLLHSAFGHAGQKCSAASLFICEGSLYDDLHFRSQLRDAASSMKVGSAWHLNTKIPPLIRPPSKDLLKALTSLEEGEEWLLEPFVDPFNANLWSPGIKLGVKENSFMHQTEFFGPVLGIMRADNLMHAIKLANSTSYGLTSGLHSLDEREHQIWKKHIRAGNCYINRGITGAIVQRQPFGGWKESCFGPGGKAGGPNYLLQFVKASETGQPHEHKELSHRETVLKNALNSAMIHSDAELLEACFASYVYWWNAYKRPRDPSLLVGQDNFFYLLPREHVVLRVQPEMAFIDIAKSCAAAFACGTPLRISIDSERATDASEKKSLEKAVKAFPSLTVVVENEGQFFASLKKHPVSKIRLVYPPSENLRAAVSQIACHLAIGPIASDGSIELLHYTKEQSLSYDYHRYGNLEAREGEMRRPLIN